MVIKHRFAFSSSDKHITTFLKKHQIEIDAGEIVSAVEIFENNEGFNEIVKFLTSHNIHSYPSTSQCIYTKEEIENAEWLKVRSTWINLYPQPQNDFSYINITYDTKDSCDGRVAKETFCHEGLVQKDSFLLRNKPNWGSRNFLMINWVHDEFFVSDKVELVFKDNNVKGLEFYKVLYRSRKEMEGIKQIYIQNYLPPGLKKESIEKEILCSKCDTIRYLRKLGYIFYDKEAFKDLDVDIIKSSERFGEITRSSMIFVNQRLRKIIMGNKLGKDLLFEPIQLV